MIVKARSRSRRVEKCISVSGAADASSLVEQTISIIKVDIQRGTGSDAGKVPGYNRLFLESGARHVERSPSTGKRGSLRRNKVHVGVVQGVNRILCYYPTRFEVGMASFIRLY
jgi:hypothetical protein